MSKKRRGPASSDPHRLTVVFDFGGVLSAGHDPVPDVQELTGGDAEAVGRALWEHRDAYDHGTIGPREYWQHVADAAGMSALTDQEVDDLQDADNRYFLHLDPDARALVHDLARNRIRILLLSNASVAFGGAVRRADWFEAFTFAVVSGEEGVVKPDAEIYRTLLDALAHESGGVARPGDVIFFDDRQDNVDAARALGIDAHVWPRNGDPLPDGGRPGAEVAREVLSTRGIPLG
jgi:putative hydrolase of the HAD superfamily